MLIEETTMTTAESKITTDHNLIRKWAEERQGHRRP